MSLIFILVRLGLVGVFGVAGFAKLLDRRGTREAVINFGTPAKAADAVGLLLPLAEIAIAIGLLLEGAARWSAVGALALLGIFIAAIAVNLGRGRAPDCHCFGQLHSKPLGWSTLLRNIVFALGAGLIVWQTPARGSNALILSSQLGGRDVIVLTALLVVALAGGALLFLQHSRSRRNAAVTTHDHATPAQGLPLGAPAPEFELPTYQRTRSSLVELLESGKPLLLMFSNPKCGPCVALFEELAQWQRVYEDDITIAVLSQGTVKENFVNVARNGLKNVLLQQEREVADSYQATVTPTAVIVANDRRIVSNTAAGADEIRNLMRDTLGNRWVAAAPTLDQATASGYLSQPSAKAL
jgi:thiol-disulfide isomerase/thioredoxin